MGTRRGGYEGLVPKPNCTRLRGTFQCNAASNPASTTFRGNFTGFTVAYGATGLFTVTLPSGWGAKKLPNILVSNSYVSGTPFTVARVGEYNPTTHSFVIGCFSLDGTNGALAPTAVASNTITFDVEFVDTDTP
jgi:hypothetical protein